MDVTTTVRQIIAGLAATGLPAKEAALARCESLLANVSQENKSLGPLVQVLAAFGASAARSGALDLAMRSLRLALHIDSDQLQLWLDLSGCLLAAKHFQEALGVLDRATVLFPGDAELRFRAGYAMQASERVDEAVSLFCTALELDSGHINAMVGLGGALPAQGDYEGGAEILREALALDPGNPMAVLALADVSLHSGNTGEVIATLPALAASPSLPGDIRARACFLLGQLYDRDAAYDTAFDWFSRGNSIMFRGFDLELFATKVDLLCDFFHPGYRDFLPSSGLQDETPVFIIGMPRSGTTLVEQILASHSQVHGAGELEDINNIVRELNQRQPSHGLYPHCLRQMTEQELAEIAQRHLAFLHDLGAGAGRVIDKMPRNFLHVGLIRLLFPGARIIHCTRDARDTCLSCYFQVFAGDHPYSYDLATLGHYYRHYERLMRHWQAVSGERFMQVQYEELVSDQDACIRRLLEFCGLEWEESCLHFYQTRRAVGTASRDQVRSPVYSSSAGRWRHYEHHLAPLLEALAATD